MTDTLIPAKDSDESCARSECCQTKKTMCEQHPNTRLRANCSRAAEPERERPAPEPT